jgi:hypothetical protein
MKRSKKMEWIVGKNYRNRKGDILRLIAKDVDLPDGESLVMVDEATGILMDFYEDGRHEHNGASPLDVVEGPIDERPDIQWSKIPDWFRYFAEDEDGGQYFYCSKPRRDLNKEVGAGAGVWSAPHGDIMAVPKDHRFKTDGDWKKSLRVRPGYEEKENGK